MTSKRKDYEIGSGNVFADIGVPNADEHLIKARLVYKISQIIEKRGLTQAVTAKKLGVKQPDISNMLRGQFRQFSVERLMRFLVALNHDVEIVVKEHHDKRSDPSLQVALAAF